MNGGGLVRTPKPLLFIPPGSFGDFRGGSGRFERFGAVRENHRASECTLQGLLRLIDSRGEANLVSPRGFQKVNVLVICVLAKTSSRGEFHEVVPKADLSNAR